MSDSWQNKDIDEWTCNELQQWIRHKNIGFKYEKILIDAIREDGITGEDFNSIQEANDLQDQFPGINITIANKLYFGLLSINNSTNDNDTDYDTDNDSHTSTPHTQTPYTTERRASITICNSQTIEQKEEYSAVVQNEQPTNNDSLSARGHRTNKRSEKHWKQFNVSDSDDNKQNNLQSDSLGKQRITKLKKEYENKMRKQEKNADEWRNKYNALKSANDTLKEKTQVFKQETNILIEQLNNKEQNYLDRIHDLTAEKIELSDSNTAYNLDKIKQTNDITQLTKQQKKTLEELKQLKLENIGIEEQYKKLIQEKEKESEKHANDIREMKKQQLIQNKENSAANINSLNDLKLFANKYQTEMNEYKTFVKGLQDNIKKLKDEKKEINVKYLMMSKSKNELLTESKRIKNERNDYFLQIKSKQYLSKNEIDTANKENNKLLKRLQSVENMNDKLQKQISQCKQKIKTLKVTNKSQKNLEIEYNALLEEHSECADEIEKLQKWKTKYFDKDKQLTTLRKEKLNIEHHIDELNDKIKELENKLNKTKNTNIIIPMISAPCDIMDDYDTDYDYDKKEEYDDELCKLLQHDLENYINDQSKNKKNREKTQGNSNTEQNKKKKNGLVLNQLKIFHQNKSQILRNWNILLKKNHFSTLFEKLEEQLEDKYEENDEIDSEKLAYNILFDCVIECYDILHTQHIKIINNEYLSPNVINMVQMNICTFYDLMKRQKLKKRIANIYIYINHLIDTIYKTIQKKHANDVNDENKDSLCQFIVNCCELTWSVLHYDFNIYPLNFLLNVSDTKYNDKIHEKKGAYKGDEIKYCVFPAVIKNNDYQTKIWVICDDE